MINVSSTTTGEDQIRSSGAGSMSTPHWRFPDVRSTAYTMPASPEMYTVSLPTKGEAGSWLCCRTVRHTCSPVSARTAFSPPSQSP